MKRANKAVSETVGTLLLLGIAVTLFSVIYLSVLTVFHSTTRPSVNLICTVEENNVILEHRGGKTLDLDTELSVTIAGINEKFKVGDYLNNESKDNGVWNMGERVIYPAGDVMDLEVWVSVVDVQSNSVIMMGIIQEGATTPSLETQVNPITPYEQSSSLLINATGDSGLNNVTLWYRYSVDNSSWDGWVENITDDVSPWQWNFIFPNATGYYEFYSIGKKSGSPDEIAPVTYDARCRKI